MALGMPSGSCVWRTGGCDSSTSRMISALSDGGHLMLHLPHLGNAFFQQTVFEDQAGHGLLESAGLPAQILDLAGRRGPSRVAGKPPLAGFQKLLRPARVQRRGDAFSPAALLAAQAFQHDAYL